MAAAVRLAMPEPFEAVSKPLTVSPVRVPSDVMFGWKGWETTIATFALATLPTMAAAVKLAMPRPFEDTSDVVAITLGMRRVSKNIVTFVELAVRTLATLIDVRFPREVMLGWAGCETTRATLALATLPVMAAAVRFAIPEPLEAVSKPLTVRPVRVPRDVMLGWAG